MKLGANGLKLNGVNTFTGGVSNGVGTITLGNARGLGATNNAVTNNARLDLAGFSATIGNFSGTNTAAVVTNSTSTNTTFTIGAGSTANTTYAGTIVNGTGTIALVKAGTGTQTLTGANSYSGGTTINGGAIVITAANNIGTGALTLTGVSTNQATIRSSVAGLNVAALTFGGYGTLATTTTNAIASAGAISISGTGNFLNLGGSYVGAGTYTIASGSTLTGATADSIAAVIGSQTISLGSTAAVAGTRNTTTFTSTATELQLVIEGGAWNMYWNGGSTGAWNTTSASWLRDNAGSDVAFANNDNAIFTGAADIAVDAGGISVGNLTSSNGAGTSVILGGGNLTGAALTAAGAGTLVVNNSASFSGGQTVNSGSTLQVGNGGTTGSIGSSATVNDGALVFNRSDVATNSSAISGTGSVSQSGSGTLVLNAANSYTGATTINNGTLQLGNASALQSSAVNVGAGRLSFGSLTAATLGGLTGNGAVSLANNSTAAVALTLNNNGTSNSYGGSLSGAGSVIVTGSGTQTLAASNSYIGVTAINNGGTLRLAATRALGTNNVFITNGAILFDVAGTTNVAGGGFDLRASGANVARSTITNGAVLTNAGIMSIGYLGNSSGGSNIVELGGAGSTLLANGGIFVGRNNSGTGSSYNLFTNSGGNAIINSGINVGARLTAGNANIFAMSGGFITNTGVLVIGGAGTGTSGGLDAANTVAVYGGTLSNSSSGAATIGAFGTNNINRLEVVDGAVNLGGNLTLGAAAGGGANDNAVNLSGGSLSVRGVLSANSGNAADIGNALNWTGGTLAFGTLNTGAGWTGGAVGSTAFTQDAGTLAAGGLGNAGLMTINGDYIQGTGGNLAFDIFGSTVPSSFTGGAGAFDQVVVNGGASLDGVISLNQTYTPPGSGSLLILSTTAGLTNNATLAGSTDGVILAADGITTTGLSSDGINLYLNFTVNQFTGGNWTTSSANWSGGANPNGTNYGAYFAYQGGGGTVAVTQDRTVKTLVLASGSDPTGTVIDPVADYKLVSSGGSQLILNAGDGSQVNVTGQNGNNEVAIGTTIMGNLLLSGLGNGTTTISGNITESGASYGVTASSSGAFNLTGSNSYSGGTTLASGILGIGGNNALGSGAVSVTGNSTLQAAGNADAANAISIAAGRTLTLSGNGSDLNLSGGISGSGGIVADFQNGGAVTLTGPSTYTGTTKVANGRLNLAANGALSGTNVVQINGGTLALNNASTNVQNAFNIFVMAGSGKTASLEVADGSTLVLNTNANGGGGVGGFFIGDYNTTRGGGWYNNGTNNVSVSGGSTLDARYSPLYVGMAFTGTPNSQQNNVSVTGGSTLWVNFLNIGRGSTGNTNTLLVDNSTVIAGVTNGNVGATNSFGAGGFTIGEGGTNGVNIATLTNGATLTVNNSYRTGVEYKSTNLGVISTNYGTNNAVGYVLIGNAPSDYVNQGSNVANTLNIGGEGSTLTTPTLTVGNQGIQSTNTVTIGAGGYLAVVNPLAGTIVTNSTVTNVGTNSFYGTVLATNRSATFLGAGGTNMVNRIVVNAGGTADLGVVIVGVGTNTNGLANGSGGTNQIVLNGGTATVTQITTNNAAAQSGANSVILTNGGTLIAGDGAATTNFMSTARVGLNVAGNGTVDSGTNNITIGSAISGAGALTKDGDGVLTVSGTNNSYSGNIAIAAGTLEVAGTLGGTNSSYAGNIANEGSLLLSSGANQTLSGAITGTGLVTKTGAGALTLSGSNTFSGDASFDGGTTVVSGSINNDGNVYAGNLNSGVSLVINGVINTAGQIIAGYNPGSGNNTITVSGASAVINTIGGIALGWDVNTGNRLIVTNAGTVNSTGAVLVGSATNSGGGQNQIIVSGAGSTLNALGGLTVADSSDSNSVTVQNGGRLASAGGTIISTSVSSPYAGSNNSVLVTGAGSIWTNAGGLTIGDTGAGAVTVADGAALVSDGIIIASGAGSSGSLTVGTGATLSAPTISFGDGSGALNLIQDDTVALSSVLSGNGALNQNGVGTTVVTGFSSGFTGSTVISAGTLQLGSADNAFFDGGLGSGSVANNGTLAFRQYNTLTFGNSLSGNGTLLQDSVGKTILTGANTSTGAVVVNNGTLQVGNGGTAGSLGMGNVTLANYGTVLAFNRADNVTVANNIGGLGGISQIGGGVLTLSGANTFQGISSVDSGSVNITGSLAGGSGRFYVGDTGSGAGLTVASGAAVSLDNIDVGHSAGSDNNSLTVNGGNLTLANALSIGADTDSGSSGNTLVVSDGGTVSSGNLYVGSAGGTSAGNNSILVTGSGSSLTANGSSAGNFIGYNSSSNSLTVSAGASFTALGNTYIGGAGGVANSATVTGAGSVWSNSGTIYAGNSGSGSLNVGSGATVTAAGIAIAGNAGSTGTVNVGAENGSDTSVALNAGSIRFGDGTGVLNFNQADSTVIASTITGIGSVNQKGNGTTILTGNNTFTGTTTISKGTLQVGNGLGAASLGKSAIVNNAALVFNNASGTQTAVEGVISGTGALTQNGGTTVLTGNNTFSGNTAISAGTLQVGGSGQLGGGSYAGSIANNGALSYASSLDQTLSGVLSGSGSVAKSGASVLSLTGNNSYTGATTVNGGTLSLGTTGSLASKSLSVTGGSTLLLGANSQLASDAALSLGGTLNLGGGSSRASQSFQSLTLTANSVIDFANLGGTSSLSFNSIALNGYSLNVYNWNGTNVWGTTSTTGGADQFTKLFTQSTLSGADLSKINFYSGGSIDSTFLGSASLAGNEIVPVPEPGVVLSALMLLGWLLFTQRALLARLIARRA